MTRLEDEKHITESARRIKILEYVKERQEAKQNTTKAIVIRYMKDKKLASRETAHYLINDLIKEGKLNKKEINSQVHFLTINEENEFNRFDQELSKIESIIDKIDKMKKNIQKVKSNDKKGYEIMKLKGRNEYVYRFQAFGDFFYPYSESIDIMLRVLSMQINDKIQFDKDLEILYRKIIRLMSKVGIFPYDTKRLIKRLDINILGLRNLTYTSEGYDKYPGLDMSLRNDLINKIEYFKKEFLSETEQKDAGPHEKSN